MSTTMSSISPATDSAADATVVGTPADKALLIIRIAAGIVFLFHGSQILFGAFNGPGLQRFAATPGMGIAKATLVGLAELCGGLALLTGVLARVGAACLVIVMLGAILLVHIKHGFGLPNGMEYAFTQLMVALAVLIDGPGVYSLSRFLPPAIRKL